MGRIDNTIDFLFRTLKGRLLLLVCTAFIATMCSGCFLFSCPACIFDAIGCEACASCFAECDVTLCDGEYDSNGNLKDDGCCGDDGKDDGCCSDDSDNNKKDDGCCSDSDSNKKEDDGCCSEEPDPTVTFNIEVRAYDTDGSYIETLYYYTKDVKKSAIEDIKKVPYWNDKERDFTTYFNYDSAYTGIGKDNKLSNKIAGKNGNISNKDALKSKRNIYIKLVEKATVGEEYTINFYEPDSANPLNGLNPVIVSVGSPISNLPTGKDVPLTEDGRLIGWKNGRGNRVSVYNGDTFHPYKLSPTDEEIKAIEINLYPVYGDSLFTVSVHVGNAVKTFTQIEYNTQLSDLIGGINTDADNGRVFKGWAFSQANCDKEIVDLTTQEARTYQVTWDMILYAVYVDGFHITLHNIEGPEQDVTDQVPVAIGDTYTFTDPVPTQGPYDFKGWYTSPDFDSYTGVSASIKITETTERDYYAKWEINTNSVIIYYVRWNGSEVYTEYTRESYEYNKYSSTPLIGLLGDNIPTGYEFNGWRKDDAYGNEPVWRDLPAGMFGALNLYAVYSPLPNDVRLYTEGGIISGMFDNGDGYYKSSIKYGETKKFPVPVKEGYDFTGWYRRNTDTQITDETGQMLASYNDDRTLMLEAHWQKKRYTVKFVTADGNNFVSPVTVEYNNRVPARPENAPPPDTGYEFDRWEDQYGRVYSDSKTVTSDLTYTAKYEPKEFTITLKLPDGATFSDGSTERKVHVHYDERGITLTVPYNYSSDWAFEGWKLEGAEGILVRANRDGYGNYVCVLSAYTYTDDIVLEAVFTK